MKYLVAVLLVIAALLSVIFIRLGSLPPAYNQSTTDLIASNQRLEKAILSFSKQIEPITKRFSR